MPLVVNSNISSLNAQRQLLNAGAELDKASERLASGKRINSAADDAAGLAISNRQTSQIRGLDQAIRNANDGISLIQTAEGALDETTNILQRMRELSVQSSNGIYSDSDRLTLDAEVQQLKSEITRIAESTSFNGKNILDGSLGKVELQVGALANQTVGFEIGKLDAKGLGGSAGGDLVGAATASTTDLLTGLKTINNDSDATAANDTKMSINGQTVGDLSTASTLNAALDIMNSNVSGVEVGAITELTAKNDGTGIIRGNDEMTITLDGADGATTTLEIRDTGSMDELVEKINAQGGGQVSASLNDEGRLVLSSDSGAKITVTDDAGGDASGMTTTGDAIGQAQLTFSITDPSIDSVNVAYTSGGTTAVDTLASNTGVQTREDGDITGGRTTTIVAGDIVEGDISINGVAIGAVGAGTGGDGNTGAADALVEAINKKSAETGVVASVSTETVTGPPDEVYSRVKLDSVSGDEISISFSNSISDENIAKTGLIETNNASTTGNSVADLDVSTQAGAQKAIDTIDKALEQINSTRSELGAVNNRLDFTVSNLSNVSENTSAARSRIVDADFAAESANLSRGQVLQQASQAMLAQANARPQQVLSLLQ